MSNATAQITSTHLSSGNLTFIREANQDGGRLQAIRVARRMLRAINGGSSAPQEFQRAKHLVELWG